MYCHMIKNKSKYAIALFIFILLFFLSAHLSINFFPDERMRYDLPKYILEHGILPVGDEMEIIDPIWGFSYGFTPYLPSLISVVFMKVASLFTTDASILLLAARMTSIISGVLTYLVCYSIGEEIFSSKKIIYLFSLLVAFLPQFIFLSSYINNDAFSVFTTSLILLMWIKGVKSNWSYKICVLLGISLGLCALTYYNAYGFILCSIFVYCISCYKAKFTFKDFLLKGIVIFLSAFVVAGWFFIRNFIIHDGDFLGMTSMYECGEKYAMDGYQMSKRHTYQVMGLRHPLLQPGWIVMTMQSFFCATGYMEHLISYPLLAIYVIILFIGFVFGIYKRKTELFKIDNYFLICLLLCMIIPILLSAHYSYSIDYQAQGRYIMSMLLPLMLIVSMGYNYLDGIMNGKILNKISISCVIVFTYILLFIYCLITYFMPYFTNIII